jgi:hypothetical protein
MNITNKLKNIALVAASIGLFSCSETENIAESFPDKLKELSVFYDEVNLE